MCKKRTGAFILTVFLLMTAAGNVFAETFENTETDSTVNLSTAEQENSETGYEEEQDPDPSLENQPSAAETEPDPESSDFPATEEETDLPVLENEAAAESAISWIVTDQDTCEIHYSGNTALKKGLVFAVWSVENGQDDLTWTYAVSEDQKNYVCTFDPSKLKHLGQI